MPVGLLKKRRWQMEALWSKYNTLFQTNGEGYIYNALSNTLLQIGKHYYKLLEGAEHGIAITQSDDNIQFLEILKTKMILMTKREESYAITERQYRRNQLCFGTSHLDLSICPTLACNFRCPYCFENSHSDKRYMSREVLERVITFIRSCKHNQSLSITWYGGEPTLEPAFEVVREITRRIHAIGVVLKEAALVTNAYLLDEKKIEQLNDLNINTVQVTIDGPQEIHDLRRIHESGAPTFQKIMENIDKLVSSAFKGKCKVRVNLDKANLVFYSEIRDYLYRRFGNDSILVYAGHVDASPSESNYQGCTICATDWKDFTLEQYRLSEMLPGDGIFPLGRVFNICSANSCNSFVIGPCGEIYKCWEDVGRTNMVVGSVLRDEPISNTELVSLYSVGTDPYQEAECLQCRVLPICGGGCSNRRLRSKYFNEHGLDYCSLYKNNLVEYLMKYVDTYQTLEMCAVVLNKRNEPWSGPGYRIICDG